MKTNVSDIRHALRTVLFLLLLAVGSTCAVSAKNVRALLAPFDDTNWPHLADSLGISVLWYEAPSDSSVLDSMYYDCMADARHGGLLVGFWKEFDSEMNVSEQYHRLRQFAIKDSTDMIPLLVVPQDFCADSLQRCLDSCRIGFGQSPALCITQEMKLPPQFGRYHVIRSMPYSPKLASPTRAQHVDLLHPAVRHTPLPVLTSLREIAVSSDSLDDLRHYYPRWRYFTDSVSIPDMIDVSHWQGDINWRKVYDSGIRYAYIKCCQGTDLIDDRCKENVKAARAAGVRVGVYHFFSTKFSAREQFRWFCQNYKASEQDLRPMLDVESNGGKLDKKALQDSVRVFMDLCEKKFGYRPILYSYQIFYNRYLAPAFWQETLMLALYREDRAPVTDGRGRASIWQYSSKGRVNGIKGNVDLNKFHLEADVRSFMTPAGAALPLVPPAARDIMTQPQTLAAPETKEADNAVPLRPSEDNK